MNFKHPEKLRAAVAAKMSWVFEDPDYAWTVPVIGKALGEWEVEDEHITKFTSSGAKSKTYVTELPGKEGTEHTHKGLSALSVGQSGVTFEDFAEQVSESLAPPFSYWIFTERSIFSIAGAHLPVRGRAGANDLSRP